MALEFPKEPKGKLLVKSESDLQPILDDLEKRGIINRKERYQKALNRTHLFPKRDDGLCACGCGEEIKPPQRRWATPDCYETSLNTYWVIKGNSTITKKLLYNRDKGICAECGDDCGEVFDADHVKEVRDGGGACGLENFQTLCDKCHKKKTAERNAGKKRHRNAPGNKNKEEVVYHEDPWYF